ncbi:hypothetical protein [uncultured Tenacibaculum sp.]|uniref:hypothetical protein n=1 Tax=uncultured Tenacibaculum sp. TaxID=174713 RepID=UPI002624A691|nr:hypothetical protein [uncultured Tenacibaculum sp.]
MTLVILAAGMRTRYGGLKQLDTISNENETIIDFSMYDAVKCGFKKVVFVVRQDFLETIKALYLPKLQNKIKVAFVCQEVTNTPEEFLTDYLNNDVYYKTKHSEHNLDRAINQFTLVEKIREQQQEINFYINEVYLSSCH